MTFLLLTSREQAVARGRIYFIILLFNGLLSFSFHLQAQIGLTIGDYRTVGSGDYDNPATWERWNGLAWMAAVAKPLQTNNLFINQNHEVRLTNNEAANNVYLFSAALPGRKLNLQNFELNVFGALQAMQTIAGEFYINNVSNASTDWIYPETGKIVFRGNSRIVVDRTSWSANTTNSRYTVVFDPGPGITLTVNSALKANAFIVKSGTVVQTVNTAGTAACSTFSFNDQAAFNGSGPYGEFIVEAGATLVSQCTAATAQIIRRTGTIPAALFHLQPGANLVLLGLDPTMDVQNFRFEGNVFYRLNAGNQRMIRTTFVTSGIPKTYNNLFMENGANKILNDSLFLNGNFTVTGGGGIVDSPTYLKFQGAGNQQIVNWAINLTDVEVDKLSGKVLFDNDVRVKRNFWMKNGQLDFNENNLFVKTSGSGFYAFEGGNWLNLRQFNYNQIPTVLTTNNATFPFEDFYQGGTRKIELSGNSPGGNLSIQFTETLGADHDPMFNDSDGTPILYQLKSFFQFFSSGSSADPIEMRLSARNLIVDEVDDLRVVGDGSASPGLHLPGIDPVQLWARRNLTFNQLNSSIFTVGSYRVLSILPVTWLSSNALWTAEGVRISWATAKEIENDRFIVHRAIGNPFDLVPIGEVFATTASEAKQQYSFTYWENSAAKDIYYQIEQIDRDDQKSFSKVFRLMGIQEKTAVPVIKVWPNPLTNEILQVSLPAHLDAEKLLVRIHSANGITFWEGKLADLNGRSAIENLKPGLYYLIFSHELSSQVIRLWKK